MKLSGTGKGLALSLVLFRALWVDSYMRNTLSKYTGLKLFRPLKIKITTLNYAGH